MKREEWRPVVGYEGLYEVSDRGRVRSLPRKLWNGQAFWQYKGRMMRLKAGSKGYPLVTLCGRGANKDGRVHVLVAAAFIGPRPSGQDVCHFDDVPTNNNVENLRYASRVDNMADSMRNGNFIVGEASKLAKLTEPDVREIRRLNASGGWSQRRLGARFGVSRSSIANVLYGKTWKHVQ